MSTKPNVKDLQAIASAIGQAVADGKTQLPNGIDFVEKENIKEIPTEPQPTPLQLILGGVLLFFLGFTTVFRRFIFLGSGLLILFVEPINAPETLHTLPFAISGLLLFTICEWILIKGSGSPLRWPAITSAGCGLLGITLLLVHAQSLHPQPAWIGGLMFLSLPWLGVASALILASRSTSTNPASAYSPLLLKAMLSSCSEALSPLDGGLLKIKNDTPDTSFHRGKLEIDALSAKSESLSKEDQTTLANELVILREHLELNEKKTAIEHLHVLFERFILNPQQKSQSRLQKYRRTANPRFLAKCALGVIYAYRKIVPSNKRRGCRFEPTCSCYAEESLLRFGFWKAFLLSTHRALRCVPNGETGRDPVPDIDNQI